MTKYTLLSQDPTFLPVQGPLDNDRTVPPSKFIYQDSRP